MDSFKMRFIVGKLSDDELLTLKNGEPVISKLLMVPDDYKLFRYKPGDAIEAETEDGNRIWTTIQNMEIISDTYSVIAILTLVHKPVEDQAK